AEHQVAGLTGGTYFENDWMYSTNRAPNNINWGSPQLRDYADKTAKTGGTARQYSAVAYLTVYRTGGKAQDDEYEIAHSMDLLAGYSWYGTRFHLTNSYAALSADASLLTAPAGSLTAQDSRARMAWYGWRAGFREQASLGKNFFAEGRVAYGPAMKYRGENYWNPAPGQANPGVRCNGTGQLVEFSFSASYKFWKQFEAEAGWMSWAYKSASGQETRYYTDGTSLAGDLTRVRTARRGAFFGLTWKY
ncbi:MAG: hypothetical protein Q7R35_15775, partial [Elusimicrobiota bacterium]|nr:hypothetical protein [Elusimicrobiota bacterium]